MKRIVKKLLEAIYFLLCFGPIPLVVGYALLGDGIPLLIVSAAMVPLAFLISLLPGYVGGKKKEEFRERSGSGNDPDPDRNLRRDTHEDERRFTRFPLRAVVCVIMMLAMAVVLFSGVIPWFNGRYDPLTRLVIFIVPVATLPLALRFCALGASSDTQNALAGIGIYVAAGFGAFVIKSDTLNQILAISGAIFIVVSLFLLNTDAMQTGAASTTGAKPPKTMRRKNRMLMIFLVVIAAAIACFSWLKEKTSWLAHQLLIWSLEALLWLADILGGRSSGETGGSGGGMDMDLSGIVDPNAKSSPFWDYMTRIAYVFVALVLLFVLFLVLRKFVRFLRKTYKRLKAYLSRFAEAVGEDYHDEQESLLDWGEVQRDMGEAIRKRVTTLFQRDKKWDEMDAREQARHIVRVLYRRAKLKPDARTLRETLPILNAEDPEAVAEAYELARYADRDPSADTLEKLRKDVRA